MNHELKKFLQLMKTALLIDVVLFAVTAMACQSGGWWSYAQYGVGLTWAGLAAMLVGLFSLLGGLGPGQAKFGQFFSWPKRDFDPFNTELPQGPHTFFLLMFIAGSLAIVGGEIFQKM